VPLECRLLLGAVALSLAAARLEGQEARAALRIAPAKLYPEMIRMAEGGEWSQLDKALLLIAPLIEKIDAAGPVTPGRILRERIAARDARQSLAAIERAALAGVALVLRQASGEADGVKRREQIRVGFSEFLAVAPLMRAARFRLSQEIERSFRQVYALAGPPDPRFKERIEALLLQVGLAGRGREESP
jgi:hypothetical protein